jgi:hypothetical protein
VTLTCRILTAETFVFEASDCDSIEDFGVNSDDHEAVSPIDRESTRFSEAIALEVSPVDPTQITMSSSQVFRGLHGK